MALLADGECGGEPGRVHDPLDAVGHQFNASVGKLDRGELKACL
ncbi:hypothetical protein ABZ912_58770 [Nonomuraea angiospora]